MKRMERDDTVPRYDRKRDCWRAWVDGIHEEGCLEYVCGEFAKAGLFYPFRTSIDKTLLGVDKFDLIDFYGGYGIPYVTLEGTRKFIESENRLNSFYAQRRKENE